MLNRVSINASPSRSRSEHLTRIFRRSGVIRARERVNKREKIPASRNGLGCAIIPRVALSRYRSPPVCEKNAIQSAGHFIAVAGAVWQRDEPKTSDDEIAPISKSVASIPKNRYFPRSARDEWHMSQSHL